MLTAFEKQLVAALEASEGYPKDSVYHVMKVETAGTFSPSVKNAAGSGAVGLIQFMPSSALALGTSSAKLAAMDFATQLPYVKKYLATYKSKIQASKDPLDVYLAVLYPALIGKPDTAVMASKGTKVYEQNAGIDGDKNGQITKGDIRAFFYRHAGIAASASASVGGEKKNPQLSEGFTIEPWHYVAAGGLLLAVSTFLFTKKRGRGKR